MDKEGGGGRRREITIDPGLNRAATRLDAGADVLEWNGRPSAQSHLAGAGPTKRSLLATS